MSPKTMPTWVAEHLIADGTMTRDRVTKTAKPRTCQKCWARVLTGLDEIGRRTEVDPTPINNLGECFALLTGRATYGIFYGELPRPSPPARGQVHRSDQTNPNRRRLPTVLMEDN